MPRIKRNIHNIIVALDLSKARSLPTVTVLTSLVQRGVPVRFGIVPIVETPEGNLMFVWQG